MRVVWTPAALSRLGEIQDFIAMDSPVAAYRVALEITTRAEATLSVTPLAGGIGHASDTRELVLRDLPYIVIYQVMR